jgi:hypothetical protein
MRDRNETRGQIDDAAGNEERRNTARPLLVQLDGGLGDAFDAANTRAEHDAGRDLVFMRLRMPFGIVERLLGRAHRVDDELVDLALLLRLHPLIGIVGAVGAVAARDAARNLAGNIRYVETVDLLRAALALDETRPRRLDAASERREHTHSGDDDTSHGRLRAELHAKAVKFAQSATTLLRVHGTKLISRRGVT